MTNQVSKTEPGQKGPARSFREHALASLEQMQRGATARSAVPEKKTVILGPKTPRYDEKHLWLMATEKVPLTPENLSKALIRHDVIELQAPSDSGQKE